MSVRFADNYLAPEPAYPDGGDPTTWAQVVDDSSEDDVDEDGAPLVTERQIQEEGLEKLATIFDVPVGGYQDPLGVDHSTSSPSSGAAYKTPKKKKKKKWWGGRKKSSAFLTFQADEGEDLQLGGGRMPVRGRAKSIALQSLADEAAITPTEETFSPNIYLAKVHRNTGYAELKRGLSMLDQDLKSKTANMRDYVAENFDHFITCIITLDSIQAGLVREGGASSGTDRGAALTAPLSDAFAEVKNEAEALFRDLLSRHEDAERIRRALDVLQRFDYLFALPGKVTEAIGDEEYAKVVRLYRRAQSLRNPDSPVVEKVVTQVFEIVNKLRADLLSRLAEVPLFSEQGDRIIGYLVSLECPSDPALHHLVTQHEQVMQNLRKLTEVFKQGLASQKARAGLASAKNDTLALVAQFVWQITSILTKTLSTMWKFAEAIASGKYAEGSVAPDYGLSQATTIVQDILESYSKRVRWALFGDPALRLSMYPSMYHAVCMVGDFLGELQCAGLPAGSLKKLSQLNDEISRFWVRECCKLVLKEVASMHAHPPTSAQSLPQRFQAVMSVTLSRLASVARDNSSLVEHIETMVASACKSFADSLHMLVHPLILGRSQSLDPGPSLDPRVEHAAQVYLSPADARSERQVCVTLLSTLRDCVLTRNSTIPDVVALLETLVPSEMDVLKSQLVDVNTVYDHLREIVVSGYVQRKAVALESLILNGVMLSGTDYSTVSEPTTVRDYAMQLLLELTFVHDELSNSLGEVEEEVSNIIEDLVVFLAHHLWVTVRDLSMSANAFALTQLQIEIAFIRRALLTYESDRSDELFTRSNDALRKRLEGQDHIIRRVDVEEIVATALASCSLQIACFSG